MNIIPIVLTIHVLIVLALIGVVLLQRSEGGALGIGGGGGGFMSGRGAANALTRMTAILAFLFFSTSLGLAIFADQGETEATILNDILGEDPGTEINSEVEADDFDNIFDSEGAVTPATPEEGTPVEDPANTADDGETPPDTDDTGNDNAEDQPAPEETASDETTSSEEDGGDEQDPPQF